MGYFRSVVNCVFFTRVSATRRRIFIPDLNLDVFTENKVEKKVRKRVSDKVKKKVDA